MKYSLSNNLAYKNYGNIRIYYTLDSEVGKFYEVGGSGIIIMDFINSHGTVYQEEILQFLNRNMIKMQDGFEEDIKNFLVSMVKEGIIKEIC